MMMTTRRRPAAPALVAGVIGGATTAVLSRMEKEYDSNDTLHGRTVVALYGTYGAYIAALVWASRRRVWPVPLPPRVARSAGTALAVAGVSTALAGIAHFGSAAQVSGTEPGSLHTSGIYRHSRNPQYLGLSLATAGAAVTARSAFAGCIAICVWSAYRRWIPNEEQHLTRIFGDEYLNYQANVRRWLGAPDTRRHTRNTKHAFGVAVR